MKQSVDFDNIDVHRNVRAYFASEDGSETRRHPDDRFASFDYCFNYFQSFRDEDRVAEICDPENIQQSCLQIGFYLASWGMLRKSYLLKKSVRFYERLLRGIVDSDKKLWEIDVDSYTDENIALLLHAAKAISEALGTEEWWPSDTLVTKIMLGVYGNVPAFDTYFRKGLGIGSLREKSLRRVADFYDQNRSEIDECANSIHTLDFGSGEDSDRHYTKAKIVDMVGVMEGAK